MLVEGENCLPLYKKMCISENALINLAPKIILVCGLKELVFAISYHFCLTYPPHSCNHFQGIILGPVLKGFLSVTWVLWVFHYLTFDLKYSVWPVCALTSNPGKEIRVTFGEPILLSQPSCTNNSHSLCPFWTVFFSHYGLDEIRLNWLKLCTILTVMYKLCQL